MKIESLKQDFYEMFEERRLYDTIIEDQPNKNEEWRQFKRKRGEDMYKEPEDQEAQMPDFENTMIIDTIRAIRNDRKERAKRANLSKKKSE